MSSDSINMDNLTNSSNIISSSSSKMNDSLNMFLVSTQLTGNENYRQWKFSIRIALGAKKKLGFIDGTSTIPETGATEIEDWESADCMVRSWLLNSMSKEISGAFIFSTTARDLWLEIEEHFGESNGPLIYQIQRQIASISQGTDSLSKYYTRLKQLWDELNCITTLPPCNCGAAKAISDMNSTNKLMQFLMGLNDIYDNLRNQILVLEPLPSVHKAYSMALRVEKHREIQTDFSTSTEMSAMHVRSNNFKKQTNYNNQNKQRSEYKQKSASDRYCDVCRTTRHTRETCFKIHGCPDWFKELKEKKKANFNSANMADNMNQQEAHPLQETSENNNNNPITSESFNNLMLQFNEFLKTNPNLESANLTHFGDFAGPAN